MRIKKINIDGFGIHQNLKLEDISPNLNVVYGKNEEGKTTIKDFVNTIFFGFKSKNDLRRHEPLNGGNHGGSLTLATPLWEGIISRDLMKGKSNVDANVVSVRGQENIKLEALLMGISEKVYENVFSFGLDELNKLSNLTDKEVMDYIYTAGLGLNNSSLKNIRKGLKGEMDTLWKLKGKKGINEDLEHLKGVNEEKVKLQSQSKAYVELQERLENLSNQKKLLEEEKKKLQRETVRLDLLHKGLPIYKELNAIENTIVNNQVRGNFTADDKNELLNLNSRLEELNLQLLSTIEQLEGLAGQISNTEVKEKLLESDEEINHLLMHIPVQRQSVKHYDETLERLTIIDDSIYSAMEKLNGVLTKELEKIKLPLGVEGQLEDNYGVYSEKKSEMEILQRELDNLRLDMEIYEKEIELLGEEIISQKIRALNSVRAEKVKEPNNKSVTLFLISFLLMATIFVGWMGYPFWVMALLAASLLPLTGAYLHNTFFLPRKKSHKIKESLQKMGYNHDMTLSEIEIMIRDLEKDKASIDHLTKEKEKLSSRKENKEKIYLQLKEYLNELNFEKEKLLEEIGIDKKSNFKTAIDATGLIDDVKKLQLEKSKLTDKLRDEKAKMDEFTEKAIRLLDNLNYKVEKNFEEIAAKLELISLALKDEKVKHTKLTQLKDSQNSLSKELKAIEAKKEEVLRRTNELLLTGQVHSLEEYLQRYKEFEGYLELAKQRENLISKLETVCPDHNLLNRYKDWTVLDVQQKLKEMEEELARLGEEIEANNVAKGKITQEIHTLEESDSLEKLLYEEMHIKEKVRKQVINWCKNKLALSILEVAVKEYEDKYQPEVFKRAEKYFSFMTDNRYTRVKLKGETQEIVVLNSKGREISSEFLSRGTQEQLYICVRLGLMEEFSEKNGNLPALFDDVFVNFDDHRAHKAVEALLEFSKKNQVIFFTCHRRILDILNKTGNNTTNIINLS